MRSITNLYLRFALLFILPTLVGVLLFTAPGVNANAGFDGSTDIRMASEGEQVVNKPLGYSFDAPGDSDSPYSNSPFRTTTLAVSSGISRVNSAGGVADNAWPGAFTDAYNDGRYEWGTAGGEGTGASVQL